jgi:hypothetical protein
MTQLDLNFARARRDDGIARSAEHSGDDWQDAAFQCVAAYAKTHAEFLTEDARLEAYQSQGLEIPADDRCWGQVMRRACRLGIVKKDGYKPAKSSNLSPKPLWKSLICVVSA